MMLAMGFLAMNGYIIFRTYKRKTVIGSSLHENLKTLILKNQKFRQLVPNHHHIHWIDYSLGAQAAEDAVYKFNFMSPDNNGSVYFNGTYLADKGYWKVNNISIEVKDKKGNLLDDPITIGEGPKL